MKWVDQNHPPQYKLITPPLKALATTSLPHGKLNISIYDFTGYAAEKHKVNSDITGPQVYSTGETTVTKTIHHIIMNAIVNLAVKFACLEDISGMDLFNISGVDGGKYY